MVQKNTPDTFQNELPQQNDLNISIAIAGFGGTLSDKPDDP